MVGGVEKCGEAGGNEGLAAGLLQGDANQGHKEAQLSLLLFIQVQLLHLLQQTQHYFLYPNLY